MNQVINESTDQVIIVCGNFAKVYFKELLRMKKKELLGTKELEFKKVLYVPHPSRYSWNKYVNWKREMDEMLALDFHKNS